MAILTPPPTTQVLLKELCPKCRGAGDIAGLGTPPRGRVRCDRCDGSGIVQRWVNLLELYDLISAERRRQLPAEAPASRQRAAL